MNKFELTFLHASSVILESNLCKKKILIDGPQSYEGYMPTPADAIDKLCRDEPPFNDIALLLCTHFHEDHFSARHITHLLSNREDMKFISNSYTLGILKNYAKKKGVFLNPHSLISHPPVDHIAPIYQDDDIKVEAINFIHQGKQNVAVPMTAFVINMNHTTIFFAGDIGIDESNTPRYMHLPKIDLAILPFYFVATAYNQKIVLNAINPSHLVCIHAPRLDQHSDLLTLYNGGKRYYEKTKNAFMPCTFLENYMQKYSFLI